MYAIGTNCEPYRSFTLEPEGAPVAVTGGARPEGSFACVLDHLGAIECEGEGAFSAVRFDDGPYLRMVGSYTGVCVQRWDHVVVCSDGDEYDWGPLRDLAIGAYSYRRDPLWSTEMPGDWGFDYSVCAITEDDRIVCDGLFYSQEVLDALEDL
ncbi:MAG: hypothetical protein H6736_00780 [Alphaproteobacteria bacterium]|nr:hypothetical protein [Alphaproteobacteria bacterium]MCB9690325.1 hypothetical protein [Alphaproteobacteria bacterium]